MGTVLRDTIFSENWIIRTVPVILILIAGSASLSASPLVIPQKQATHFCQLFASDGGSLSPISVHAHRTIQPDDSLSVEQIFAGYILLADGWQTMRLFPHQEDGVVLWYSATDELPASIDSEHQKYIREVFPRLIAEVQAGHWQTVDDYIDRMIQYQCQFGSQKLPPRPSSAAIIWIFILFLVLIILGINKSIFTLGISRKPASFYSFLLFKKFSNSPKG
ncbi:MAG: hypothetical protein J5658_11375 [Prevotella sp.]|nr:hypothetical protein [Prevotella sp.]